MAQLYESLILLLTREAKEQIDMAWATQTEASPHGQVPWDIQTGSGGMGSGEATKVGQLIAAHLMNPEFVNMLKVT